MKAFRALVVALLLPMLLVACSPAQQPPGGSSSTNEAEDSAPTWLTTDDVEQALVGELASQPWANSITSLTETVLLGRPAVSIGFADAPSLQDARSPILEALEATGKWGLIEFFDPDMSDFSAVGSPSDFDAVELPAPPASADDVMPWFGQAFGPGSPYEEQWVAHVKSVEFAESLPSGFGDVVVVRTDLPWDSDGRRAATVIVWALAVAEPPFAKAYSVRFNEGDYEMTGELAPGMASIINY